MIPLFLLIYIPISLLGLENNMPSSITKIYDEKTGKMIEYDMEKGFDQIDAAKLAQQQADASAAADAATKKALDDVAKSAAVNTPATSTTPWTSLPYESMSPQQKTEATKIAEAYNKTLEQSSVDVNKAKYGATAKFLYPEAATIWNPKTGTKRAVRLDMMTGKIWNEDFNALPDDLNPNKKGGNWALWTGGMASGSAAQKAIASDPSFKVAVVPVTSQTEGGTPSYESLNKPILNGTVSPVPVSSTPVFSGTTLQAPESAVVSPAPVSPVPVGWVYINDAAQLKNIPSSYIKKDGARMYADPAKLKYIGTMAEVAKVPATKRVLLNGRYYQVLP